MGENVCLTYLLSSLNQILPDISPHWQSRKEAITHIMKPTTTNHFLTILTIYLPIVAICVYFEGMARGHKGECVPGEGRPSKLPTLDYGLLQFLITEKGLTDAEVSMVLGINEDTFHEWKKKNKKFSESVKKFKSLANRSVEKSLYQRAVGYTHEEEKIFCNADGKVTRVVTTKHYPPDPGAAKNWLSNRTRKEKDPWADKQEITGEGGGPITIQISQREAKI